MPIIQKVLILCTGNSCRSQMAEGILQSFNPARQVFSAGTQPAARVHPYAVRVMAEIGIDISGSRPKHISGFLQDSFDAVITVCGNANDSCPVFTGRVNQRLHIGFADPAEASGTEEEILGEFRRVRDEIYTAFSGFYKEHMEA